MKTINDMMTLLGEAMNENTRDYKTWFFSFSGHVNSIEIRFYPTGWSHDENRHFNSLSVYLDNEESIQCAYWWVKTKLKG